MIDMSKNRHSLKIDLRQKQPAGPLSEGKYFHRAHHLVESQQDSRDDKNIRAIGLKGKHIASTSSSNFSNVTQDEDTRI